MRAGFGEERRELHSTHSTLGKLAVAVCMLFVVGWCFMAWDYSMTLTLHWQQTMYAWIVFMAGWLGMMMSASLLSMWWRNQMKVDDLVTINHFWDLGKLCFAFTAFFGYISFAQYLVMWYGNLPEETHFYNLRLSGVWKPVTQLIPILAFALPFGGLISKAAKVYLPTFVLFAWPAWSARGCTATSRCTRPSTAWRSRCRSDCTKSVSPSACSACGSPATSPSWTPSPRCACS
jgi:hypothetical protein